MAERRKVRERRKAAGRISGEELVNRFFGPESWPYQAGADIAERGWWPQLPPPEWRRQFNPEQTTAMAEQIANLSPMGPAAAMVRGIKSMSYGKEALDLAKKMKAAGANNRQITEATGWHLGPDKLWREEFSDAASKLNTGMLFGPHPGEMRMTNFLEDVIEHPEFFKSYPSLRELRVTYDPYKVGSHFQGGYSPKIVLGGGKQPDVAHAFTPEQLRSTLLHEMQHSVQGVEGFLRGGGPEQMMEVIHRAGNKISQQARTLQKLYDRLPPGRARTKLAKKMAKLDKDFESIWEAPNYEAYKALYGEAEARAVQKRMNMFSEMSRRQPGEQFLDEVRRQKPLGFPDFLYRTQGDDVLIQKPFSNWEEIQKAVADIEKVKGK